MKAHNDLSDWTFISGKDLLEMDQAAFADLIKEAQKRKADALFDLNRDGLWIGCWPKKHKDD